MNALTKPFGSGYILADSVPDPPEAQPKRVAVDETAVKINGEWSWLYAAIDLDTKLILDVALFGRHGTDPAAAFLSGLAEQHDFSDTTFLVDQFGYQTSLARLGLNGGSTTPTETSSRNGFTH